jgi:WD40 repeat protein
MILLPGALSESECVETIAAAERHGFEAMGPRYPAGYRNNDRAVVDDAKLAERLFERLSPALPATLEESGARWRLAGLNARFRFCRYRDGQSFTRHRDGAWAPSATRRSWLTAMIYLNDASTFAGGATRFYGEAGVESVPPRAGQAIVFDHRLWHDGEAVREGTKYVMRTDVIYELEQAAPAEPLKSSGGLECERVLRGHDGYVWAVRRVRDGRLVSGSRDGTVRAWGNGEVVRRGEGGSVMSLLEVDGQLWSGRRDGRVDDGRCEWQAHAGAVLGLERATDGSVISCGGDGRVLRWSPTGEGCGELARHDAWVWGVAIAVDDVRAAVEPVTAVSVGAGGDRDGWLTLDNGCRWQAHAGAVTAIARLGNSWATAGEDSTVKLWSHTGELLGEGHHGDFVRTLCALGEGRFASGSYDGTVAIWRLSGS